MPRPPAKSAIKLPRVIFVTGKGGTGKSTVAAALALALSRHHGVTLVELDPRNAAATIIGPSESDDNPFKLAHLTPRGELEAFVESIVPIRALSRRMLQSRTFGFVTAALPGLEAFLMLDRLRRLSIAADLKEFMVVDAPATGGALEMLAVAQGVLKLAPFGTLHRLAGEVEEFLHAPDRFAVMLTLRPEALALRETIAAAESLRAARIACAATVLNGVTTALFGAAEIAGLDHLPVHQELARIRRAQAESADQVQRELRYARLATAALPTIYKATLGREELATLAAVLEANFFLR